jgi:outer membrane protein assembly factor BamB
MVAGTLHPASFQWIGAALCIVVGAIMLYQHRIAAQHDPWKSPQLLALKEQLRAAPTDESLRNEIRRLDLEFRQRYVRRLALDRTGGWLLIGGMAVMLLGARTAVRLAARPHLPQRKLDLRNPSTEWAAHSRWSVVAVGGVVCAVLATFALTTRSSLPDSAAGFDKLPGAQSGGNSTADLPSLAEFNANWPRFRGPDGGGVAVKGSWNFEFDKPSGMHVVWKSPLPASGYSSPILWANRVFISGGDSKERRVFCYDAAYGDLLWQRVVENVPGSPAQQPEIYEQPGFAASTMATDGRYAFVIFANGDLAAFTVDGQPVWSNNIGVPKNPYGHATSLAIWPGKLFVQLDQDEGARGGSRLLAFDCATGRPLWERARPVPASWASPIIVETGGKIQLITLGQPWIISYSAADGSELWRAELLDGEITPSPIFSSGLVVAINPSGSLVAIRPDGNGDVTKSHLAWATEDIMPDVTSPVSNGELIFTVTTTGGLTCFDLKDGKRLWDRNLEMEVQASPGIAGGRLLLTGTKGELVVVEAAREFREVGRTRLDDVFYASPAFVDGRMYLRGTTNLWCLGER